MIIRKNKVSVLKRFIIFNYLDFWEEKWTNSKEILFRLQRKFLIKTLSREKISGL